MTYKVEKDWTTKAGFRAVVIHTGRHRCGYVAVTKDHPLFGLNYNDTSSKVKTPSMEEPIGKRGIMGLITSDKDNLRLDAIFNVHGSLTYSSHSSNESYPVPGDNLWWFGYDCAHCDDASDPNCKDAYVNEHGVFRSLAYCLTECESLAQQFIDRVIA